MSDGNDPLGILTPNGVTALVISAVGSLVVGLFEGVSGKTIFTASVGGALLTAIFMPIALSKGYTWQDWLAAVPLLCGLFAGFLFTLAIMIRRRWLARGDEIADGLWSLTLGRFLKKGEGK